MIRVVGGVLALLLLMPALRAEDKPREKTAAEQYKALLGEYEKANQTFMNAFQTAKSQEERMKVFQEKNPRQKFGARFVALAGKYPKDAVAVDALSWVLSGDFGTADQKDRARAVELLQRDHVQSDKLGAVCQALASGMDRTADKLLRAVLQKNKSKAVQAEACLALAQRLQQRVSIARLLKSDAAAIKGYEQFYGKETVAELLKAGPAGLEAESTRLFKRLSEEYLDHLKTDRLKSLCRTLSFDGGKGGEVLLRALLEKDSRRDVQGVACLALAQVLKQRADDLTGKAAEKTRTESEKLFERAVDKYGDVKQVYGGTVGEKAKSELFDLRFLAVGKKAPDVEGVDQDGKKFKLSDYQGKVVFLDFWSQY